MTPVDVRHEHPLSLDDRFGRKGNQEGEQQAKPSKSDTKGPSFTERVEIKKNRDGPGDGYQLLMDAPKAEVEKSEGNRTRREKKSIAQKETNDAQTDYKTHEHSGRSAKPRTYPEDRRESHFRLGTDQDRSRDSRKRRREHHAESGSSSQRNSRNKLQILFICNSALSCGGLLLLHWIPCNLQEVLFFLSSFSVRIQNDGKTGMF